jgi:hypothetical protein
MIATNGLLDMADLFDVCLVCLVWFVGVFGVFGLVCWCVWFGWLVGLDGWLVDRCFGCNFAKTFVIRSDGSFFVL